MKRVLTVDANTQLQQSKASNPLNSAWVSANAGSGKTFVLSRRVVRLLLAGTDPNRILCLTFTKAAAGEMSNRVFSILGNWAVADDKELFAELKEVEGKNPTQKQMDMARTLFARALETPGGLKIQTIHAFCEALLHQFPLEANIPGNFSVMDDSQQSQLMQQAHRSVILAADADAHSDIGKAFVKMMAVASDSAIEKAINEIISRRDQLIDWLADAGGVDEAVEQLKERLQFSPDDTAEKLTASLVASMGLNDIDCMEWADICASMTQKTAQSLATQLRELDSAEEIDTKLEVLQKILLTAAGEVRKFEKHPPNAVEDALPGIRELLAEDANTLVSGLLRIKTLRSIESTGALLVLASAMIDGYRQSKRERGLLDFDDLVLRTRDLLTRKDARAWVLYKLDLGIDHILLDEAQDTSPVQWQVISALVEEFFSGQSARLTNRTVFAVGDEKQSIYSFQGAEPEGFASRRNDYQILAKGAEKPLEPVQLGLSFRSTQDVLSAVDAVFSIAENAKGLTFGDPPPAHTAARRNDPGSVEIWPLELAQDTPSPENWHTPMDQSDSRHQALRLADKIADQLQSWIGKQTIEASGKLIDAGDILVLVRSRDRFVTALTRSLKERHIPVAGADRLALTDHIAIQDLMALGQVMLTPEDDLSLAAVLKSPLIGLDEENLLQLARSRFHAEDEKSLFSALEDLKETPPFTSAFSSFQNWQNRLGQLPVFEFYARLLGDDGGRKKFYQRLGTEAEDVLDAFLSLALAHEQNGLPGLQAFLHKLEDENPQIKRELDQTAGQVRIMTVHSAKGLEAPIVFLVDKCSPAFRETHAPALYRWGDDEGTKGMLWVPASGDHGDKSRELRTIVKEKAEEEYRRLLYVAMTRAEDRLIVCGYGSKPKKDGTVTLPDPNWHTMVSNALLPGAEAVHDKNEDVLWHRWKSNESPVANPAHHLDEVEIDTDKAIPLPGWINHKLPKERALPRPLNPSRAQAIIDESLVRQHVVPSLLADKTENNNQSDFARRRGTVLHKLLQVLPDLEPEFRMKSAAGYLARIFPQTSDTERQEMVRGVLSVLDSPDIGFCFDPKASRAEVAVVGEIEIQGETKTVSGVIDRVAVLDNSVTVLDFKTNAWVPNSVDDVAADYVVQMAMYKKLLMQIYPAKKVETILVWTHARPVPRLMSLPDDVLDDAFKQLETASTSK